jgi:hypothetical protein
VSVKPLASSLNLLEIHHLKNLLEAEGIRCWIRNEYLARLAGEVPFTEVSLELHVLRESDHARAEEVLRAWRRARPLGPAWTCAGCGERLEGQFSACWRCGASRPT